MNKYGTWILERWQQLLAGFVMLLVMSSLLLFHLGTLNKGATLPEINYINSLRSGKNLLTSPVFLIHKLPTYILFKMNVHALAAYRLVSVFCLAGSVLSGFIILKYLYSMRVATLGSALLLTSAWLLHVGRAATPEACFLLILPLVLLAIWLHTTTRQYHLLLALTLGLLISFYIPGFGWLVMVGITCERKIILASLKAVPWWFQTLCAAILLGGLVPLIWATAHSPSTLLAISGLPLHLSALGMVGKNVLHIPEYILLRGPSDPARWLGRLPILDVFSTGMLILGIYSLRYHFKQHTIRLLIGSSLLVILLVTIGGLTTITALLPLLYIFIGGGVAFMIQQWTAVFPRNPIARNLATTLMSVTILLVAYFHINHYFIAWPHTPATKRVFGYNLIK